MNDLLGAGMGLFLFLIMPIYGILKIKGIDLIELFKSNIKESDK